MKTAEAPKDLDLVPGILTEVREHLEEAIDGLETIVRITRPLSSNLSGRIRSYTVGHLRKFLKDINQIGSIPDIEKDLDELFEGGWEE